MTRDSSVDLRVDLDPATYVATVELRRPPNNFFDVPLVSAMADAFEALDDDPDCRVIVLCSEGKHFCAGWDFSAKRGEDDGPGALYGHAVRLAAGGTPVIAVVQGAAVGGGLGLAMIADFRVASPRATFTCSFSRLGFHPGFGLSVTLPATIGQQAALDLMYTGRRVKGEEAYSLGLCDRLAKEEELRSAAYAFASEIATSAPLAVRSIRAMMRGSLAEQLRAAMAHEAEQQAQQRATEDFSEGIAAAKERRTPAFVGR